jgi:hypothetical protein
LFIEAVLIANCVVVVEEEEEKEEEDDYGRTLYVDKIEVGMRVR